MKKNFFKKLASGLALAMVVTSFAPAAPAFAAAATKIVEQGGKKAPQTVYVGKKVDYSLNNVYKTNSYKWFTSNAKIAKITQTGGVVTPVATGKATIKVNAYKKSTGKLIKSFKLELDVKQRATSVNIGAEDFELAVGEKKDLNAVKTPATSTDTLRYFSSNEKVATVDIKTGVVTAVAAGEATIKVASKGAWFTANNSKYNKYDEVKVTVVDGLLKVDQKAYNKLELTFSSDMEKAALKVADFSIVRDETNRVIAIEKVEVKGKMVTITTFESMVDGKVYTVAHADKKLQFTATDNVVASLGISPATVGANVATEITVSTLDAKGVILGTYKLDESEANIDFDVTTTQGYTNGNKLVLLAVGNTAKATASYHTFKYDTNGNEIGALKAELTITAVDPTAINVKKYDYTVAKNAPNWNTFAQNSKLAIKDQGYKAYVRVIKSDDTLATGDEYSFDSSNPDVLLVYDDGSMNPELRAVAEGPAYVLVKDAKGNVVFSLGVTIVPERKTGSVAVSTNAVTLSNKTGLNDDKVVEVSTKDQYLDKMGAPSIADIKVECVGTTAKDATGKTLATSLISEGVYYTRGNGKVTFHGDSREVGTYTYKISVGGFGQIVTVNIQTPGTRPNAVTTYRLELDRNVVDTTFNSESELGKRDIVIRVAELKDGVVNGYVNLSDNGNTTQDDNGNDIVIKRGTTVVTGSAISGSALTFTALDVQSNTIDKEAAGNYSVEVYYTDNNNDRHRLTGGFVVTDSQSAVTFRRNDVSTNASGIKEAIRNTFKFYYEGNELTMASDAEIKSYKATYIKNLGTTQQYHIESVTVYVPVINSNDNITYNVPVTVTMNQTIVY